MCSTPITNLAAVVRRRAQKWSQLPARSAPTSFPTWWLCDPPTTPQPPWGCRPPARRPIFTWRLSRGMQLLLFQLLLGLRPPRVLPCLKTLQQAAPASCSSRREEPRACRACPRSRSPSTRPASSSSISTFNRVKREANCDKNPNTEFQKGWTDSFSLIQNCNLLRKLFIFLWLLLVITSMPQLLQGHCHLFWLCHAGSWFNMSRQDSASGCVRRSWHDPLSRPLYVPVT